MHHRTPKRRRFVVPALAALLAVASLPVFAPGTASADDELPVERAVRHYERVERELASKDVSHLTPAQRKARQRAIDELRRYRVARRFAQNDHHPGARIPYFMDDAGRRCAVAHLLHAFGRDDMVSEVANADNHAYVSDLAGHREFQDWLRSVGLTTREAARIQVPGPIVGDPETGEPVETPDGGSPEPDGPTTGGPGGPTPTTGGGLPSTRGTGARRPGSGRSAGLGAAGAAGWWIWWELNKLDFVQPNALRLEATALSGDVTDAKREAAAAAALRQRRAKTLPYLMEQLTHADARVRGAAALAVGRVGGADAVEHLLPLLDDAQPAVRERALLALGATGAPAAADVLLRVAESGKTGKGRKQASPNARPVAILALGVARRYGFEGDVTSRLAKQLDDMKKRDQADIGTATLLHGKLSPTSDLHDAVARFAADKNAVEGLRARAVEQLAGVAGVDAMPALQRTLAGRRAELRRSAAIALADVEHELVLPRLKTAYELEKDQLTRAYILLSVAERGGAESVEFLAEELAEGKQILRPWAALALGIVARRTGSKEAVTALANADVPANARGAVWLARGLARDDAATPVLAKALAEGSNPRRRTHAATALSLIGSDAARLALLERATVEESALVRVVVAQGLGTLGQEEDAVFLLDTLRSTSDPALQGLMAVALGFHGSESALDGALDLVKHPKTDDAARATALEAVGLLLDRRPGLALPTLSRRTDFALLPDWLQHVLQIAL